MKLGSLFGNIGTKTPLLKASKKAEKPLGTSNLAATVSTKLKPGQFAIDWGTPEPQKVKDYKAVLDLGELEEYFKKCQETGLASWDYETAPSEETRAYYEPLLIGLEDRIADLEAEITAIEETPTKDRTETQMGVLSSLTAELKVKSKEYSDHKDDYLKTPLDPWKGEVCTVSFSAAPNEARVVPISHRVGKNIAPHLSRSAAREEVFKLMDKYLFTHKETLKIAVNLAFETKYSAKYGRYITGRVADPLIMWVRCMQLGAPGRLKDHKKPATGWGLKPATKATFGVQMSDFKKLLEAKGVDFFDEIDASSKEGLVYSAEDSDYGVQQYLYWVKIAKQLPDYYEWLHNIEMPFMRVIGLMEFWGMPWNQSTAQVKHKEAVEAQKHAADEIKRVIKEAVGVDANPGKTGKTGDVKAVLFKTMKLPIPKVSDTTGDPSLDEEALIDMRFMLENKLIELSEEKYLTVNLPNGWETINPDAVYGDPDFNGDLSKEERGAVRIAQRSEHPYKEAGLQLIEQMLKIQKYTTLISSHIVGREKYLNEVTQRIHAGYSTFTDTGRLNSFKPNGQNVPRPDKDDFKIRGFFSPKPGKILFFIDFSGFELRLIAWKSKDEVMIDLFTNGGDMHRRTASALTGKTEDQITKVERTNAKAGNFGITYGGTEYALQKTFKTDYGVRKTLDECAAIVKAVKTAYPRIPEMQRQAILDARENGYAGTIYGYKRLLKSINGPAQRDRSADERRAGNTPIQGSAADIMKDCQNKVYDEIGRGTIIRRYGLEEAEALLGPSEAMKPIVLEHGKQDMIAQIHDEMIFEMDDNPETVEAAGKWIKDLMERPPLPNFPVPIEAEASVGYDWSNKMSIENWVETREVQA
ncbi:bifunctional 3'-5' exonuclease/DNA polymerase [Cytobacillus praedii]|uniref:bifunctional 3'-5' exonuclease/DNA polymerase n=1 Tax=Cytobacillus praedii TaxID=1742358 RepID=UPI002E22BB96|nr:bifunctional 3'-5' exonuclease/DNA polymerase [Cytobacillus praedii]